MTNQTPFRWDERLLPRSEIRDFGHASGGRYLYAVGTYEDVLGLPRYHMERQVLQQQQELIDTYRLSASRLLHSGFDHLLFTDRVTSGMRHFVREFLPRGKKILTTDEEFSWVVDELQFQNYELVSVPADRHLLENLERNIDDDVGAILVSHVTHKTCKVLPVQEIASLARQQGLISIVDGAHAVGQIPVNMNEINPTLYLASGHKWLFSGAETGIAYMEPEPTLILPSSPFDFPNYDWYEDPQDLLSYVDMDVYGNASHLHCLGVSLKAMEEFGWNNIFAQIRENGAYLREKIGEQSLVQVYEVDNPAPGMVAVTSERPLEPLKKILERDFSILCSYKWPEQGCLNEESLRFSVHAWTGRADIDYLVDSLASVEKNPAYIRGG